MPSNPKKAHLGRPPGQGRSNDACMHSIVMKAPMAFQGHVQVELHEASSSMFHAALSYVWRLCGFKLQRCLWRHLCLRSSLQ